MEFNHMLGLILTLFLMVYLFYALLAPEKF